MECGVWSAMYICVIDKYMVIWLLSCFLSLIREYAADVNVLVAKQAIQAIGQISLQLSTRANTCVDKLLSLLTMEIDYVTSETLVAMTSKRSILHCMYIEYTMTTIVGQATVWPTPTYNQWSVLKNDTSIVRCNYICTLCIYRYIAQVWWHDWSNSASITHNIWFHQWSWRQGCTSLDTGRIWGGTIVIHACVHMYMVLVYKYMYVCNFDKYNITVCIIFT